MVLWPSSEDLHIGAELRRTMIVAGLVGSVVIAAFGIEARYNQGPTVQMLAEKQIDDRCATLWMQKRIALLEQERARVLALERREEVGTLVEEYVLNHYENELQVVERTLDKYRCGLR